MKNETDTEPKKSLKLYSCSDKSDSLPQRLPFVSVGDCLSSGALPVPDFVSWLFILMALARTIYNWGLIALCYGLIPWFLHASSLEKRSQLLALLDPSDLDVGQEEVQ